MSSFIRINACRICGNTELVPVLSLGHQFLTGVFPASIDEPVTRGPLELVRCGGGPDTCGLVQLHHSYSSEEMYGNCYGYRSGLNRSMVDHLRTKAQMLLGLVSPSPGDTVLDIGSNDGTTLSFFSNSLTRIGIDPTADRFREFYDEGIIRIADFFSARMVDTVLGGRKAKIITSIAMFYDLDDPQDFVNQIAAILADDGVWHFEQSYLPAMIDRTAYDTICHEHVEYYALRQVEWLLERAGLRILDVEMNDINGGSFAITAARRDSRLASRSTPYSAATADEAKILNDARTFDAFSNRVAAHRSQMRETIGSIWSRGQTVFGYGASTKGNVILQYCGFTPVDIPCIAEVNEEKFGKFTPGTAIPIISESDARAMRPDYFLVLPWHFRNNLIEREREFLQRGGRLIFPLPTIDTVGAERH